MQEKITINDFLVVKKAVIEVKKINIIIGPQANGKSIIAKILHYFKSIHEEILDGIRKNKGKRDLDKSLIESFEKRFPRYSWEGTSFSIKYETEIFYITITGKKNSPSKTNLSINYSDLIIKTYNSKRKLFIKKVNEITSNISNHSSTYQSEDRAFYEHVIKPLQESELSGILESTIFIPATRSFFANLQKNIFTFLASNLDIDPYLKDFGSLYETSKRWYKNKHIIDKKKHSKITNDLQKSIESIISGDYEYNNEQDWIVNRGHKINLANASSGQQEALPMLITLCVWPIVYANQSGMYFIEEPEAHLFPTSQGNVMSIISQLYSEIGTKFFITTHSPYIISALNNFIMAFDKVSEKAITEDEFIQINGGGRPINFDDVSAYSMFNGESKEICESDYRIVGASMLDGISEHFELVMNKLLSSEAKNGL